ncbi:MAG TPA: hypothetical protein VLH86_03475 [Patescibacteria group bacterium]|nr:hypothetical protein [Patescibacteria group bacterium]
MTLARALRLLLVTLSGLGLLVYIGVPATANADCPVALPKNLGQDTLTVKVAETGSYRLWVRLYAPSVEADSVVVRVDDAYCAVTVGNSGKTAAKAFTWVNYQDGDPNKPVDLQLTAGDHTIVIAGTEAGVGVDRLLFLSDKNCVPTGTGDNCGDATNVTIVQPFAALSNNGTPHTAAPETAPKSHTGRNIVTAVVGGVVLLGAAAVGLGWYWRSGWRVSKLWGKP